MAKDFTVTITDPERAAEWQAILGTTTVHVQSPIPFRADLPGHPDACIYYLDLELLTSQQRLDLLSHLAQKFNIDGDEARLLMIEHGVPILPSTASLPSPTHIGGFERSSCTRHLESKNS